MLLSTSPSVPRWQSQGGGAGSRLGFAEHSRIVLSTNSFSLLPVSMAGLAGQCGGTLFFCSFFVPWGTFTAPRPALQ